MNIMPMEPNTFGFKPNNEDTKISQKKDMSQGGGWMSRMNNLDVLLACLKDWTCIITIKKKWQALWKLMLVIHIHDSMYLTENNVMYKMISKVWRLRIQEMRTLESAEINISSKLKLSVNILSKSLWKEKIVVFALTGLMLIFYFNNHMFP